MAFTLSPKQIATLLLKSLSKKKDLLILSLDFTDEAAYTLTFMYNDRDFTIPICLETFFKIIRPEPTPEIAPSFKKPTPTPEPEPEPTPEPEDPTEPKHIEPPSVYTFKGVPAKIVRQTQRPHNALNKRRIKFQGQLVWVVPTEKENLI